MRGGSGGGESGDSDSGVGVVSIIEKLKNV